MKNILRTFIICILLLSFVPIISSGAHSGDDSLIMNQVLPEEPEEVFMPDPRKATLYSAVLPGMGQMYNRKYWKVPIVYGGFVTLGWYTRFNHIEFIRYRNALNFRNDGNPETVDEFADDFRYTNDVLTRFNNYYRRQRDLSIILTALFYTLNIIDAAVDSHLFHFDVSEDLGVKIGPSFSGNYQPMAVRPVKQMGIGVRLSLNF